MRRVLIVLGVILAAAILIAGIVYLAERDNINAVITAATSSPEELEQQMAQSQAELQDEFSKEGIDLGAIETQVLSELASDESEVVAEDAAAGSDAAAEPARQPQGDEPTASASEQTPAAHENPNSAPGRKADTSPKQDNAEVEAILAEFYRLQASYSGKIDGICASAIAEYRALPKEERTTANKIAIGRRALSSAYALEGACDSEVVSLTEELRSALKRSNMDTSLADSIFGYYSGAKNTKKAEYLSKYGNQLS